MNEARNKGCECCDFTGRAVLDAGEPPHWTEEVGPCDRCATRGWLDLPDTDGLWWMWAGEGHDPEPVRVRTERENARDPRREYLYVERLGHEDTTHLDDVCERYGVISLRWRPLQLPKVPPT